MDWTELYPFLFGIGLIAAVMLAYGLGLHVGKRQERVAISRKRWKQKQFLIGRHQTEREQYLEKIRFLKRNSDGSAKNQPTISRSWMILLSIGRRF